MLKSSEHEKYDSFQIINPLDCSKVRSAEFPILFYYLILRIGAPEYRRDIYLIYTIISIHTLSQDM